MGECLVVMPNQAAVRAGIEEATRRRRATIVPASTAAGPNILIARGAGRSTTPQKLCYLKEAGQAAGSGEICAIVQRQSLYSSALCGWRCQREAGALGRLTSSKRGQQPAKINPPTIKLTAS
jgi:hypothetical protein